LASTNVYTLYRAIQQIEGMATPLEMDKNTPPSTQSESEGPSLDIPIPILHELIVSSVRQHSSRTALVCKHQPADLIPVVEHLAGPDKDPNPPSYLQWSHAQLQYGADLLVVGLVKAGVQQDSTIAVMLNGRAEFYMALRASARGDRTEVLDSNCLPRVSKSPLF
jgi:hypothetical protein